MTKRKGVVMGKYGIAGNSGLTGQKTGLIHISANYDSNGMVFVATKDWWRRVKKATAKAKKMKPITCAMCKAPAVSLDHHYPYMSDMNRCAKHHGK